MWPLARHNKQPPKHMVVFPGYGVNPARANGADIEPLPINPVHGQSWPGMQVQLSNGWMRTCYGRRLSYDDYLRLLRAENGIAGVRTLPGQGLQRIQGPGPAQISTSFIVPSATVSGGVGQLADGVVLDQTIGRNFN